MEIINVTEIIPVRIDKYLASLDNGLTRSYIQKLISDGCVKVNGKICGKKTTVKCGDIIETEMPAPAELKAVPQNLELNIVYEDNDVIVVNKPRGMVVHPAPGNPDGTLVNALLYHCRGRLSSINGVIRPGIVHRIDKDTSGLLMVAKNDEAHLGLSEQIKEHSFKREYIALAKGIINDDKGRIDRPIGRNTKDRKKMAVTYCNSKEAITDFEVLKRYNKHTLLRCTLYTGRTHQIRVHLASIGHPIAGDKVYGPNDRQIFDNGQLLHAALLGFVHPKTGEYMEFTADIPDDFKEVLKKNL